MGPWGEDVSNESTGNFWEDFTNSLLGGGARYFEGQMVADTKIKLANTISNAVAGVLKFIAVVFVLGTIVKVAIVVFKRK